MILCLEPHLLGAALAAYLSRQPGLDVISDPSGASVASAESSDVVISTQPFVSNAAVLLVHEDGTQISVHRTGRVESLLYRGLEWLSSLIEEQRGPLLVEAGSESGGCG